MVEVEIRTPVYNQEDQTVGSDVVARVTADNASLVVEPAGSLAVPFDAVVSRATGRFVEPESDPQEWVRNLPYAYRAGDLVAVLISDDDAPTVEPIATYEHEPVIPDPARAEAADELYAS